MSLNEWLKFGWLIAYTPVAGEIDELLEVARRDIHDAQTRGLSDDWRFNIAYNAALQLARALLLSSGYQIPKGDSHHYRAIDSLKFTASFTDGDITLFQTFRKKRSVGVYETVGAISAADARNMLELATRLNIHVRTQLKKPQ